jgi:hypothetical protein
MSVHVDQPVEIRTIDIVATYDTTVVRPLGGGAGSLYTESGVYTFQGFEDDEPGQWHGYAVIIGADKFILGPGELFYWEFEGLADGVTPIIAVEIYLSTTDGSWFADVELPPATVTVGDGLSTLPEVPLPGPGLHLYPNPFNPGTRVQCELLRSGRTSLSVHDLRGRRLAVLFDAPREAGLMTVDWDGRDSRGMPAPGGVYLFRLVGPGYQETTKGVLVK